MIKDCYSVYVNKLSFSSQQVRSPWKPETTTGVDLLSDPQKFTLQLSKFSTIFSCSGVTVPTFAFLCQWIALVPQQGLSGMLFYSVSQTEGAMSFPCPQQRYKNCKTDGLLWPCQKWKKKRAAVCDTWKMVSWRLCTFTQSIVLAMCCCDRLGTIISDMSWLTWNG